MILQDRDSRPIMSVVGRAAAGRALDLGQDDAGCRQAWGALAGHRGRAARERRDARPAGAEQAREALQGCGGGLMNNLHEGGGAAGTSPQKLHATDDSQKNGTNVPKVPKTRSAMLPGSTWQNDINIAAVENDAIHKYQTKSIQPNQKMRIRHRACRHEKACGFPGCVVKVNL